MQYDDEAKLDAVVDKVETELTRSPTAFGWHNVGNHLNVRPEILDELAWEQARANLENEAERIAAEMDDNFVEYMLRQEDGESQLDRLDMDYTDPFVLDDIHDTAEELVQQYGPEYFSDL